MTRKRTLAPIADTIAADIQSCTSKTLDWDTLREECDRATGGELDCQPLDILTDMVEKRIKQCCESEPST